MKLASFVLFLFGALMLLYFSFPLLSFQIYLQPVFASQNLTAPIPSKSVLSEGTISTLIRSSTDPLIGMNLNDARNWYPSVAQAAIKPIISSYSLSVPVLKIENAQVSTVDNDLSHHLVQYGGTTIPPEKGTAVVYGHSTLPQLYREGDYKTIFAYAHTLKNDDEIVVTLSSKKYTYKIYSISITDPSDTSFFQQNYDGNYLVIVTCTPPGTTWKRLIIRSKLV